MVENLSHDRRHVGSFTDDMTPCWTWRDLDGYDVSFCVRMDGKVRIVVGYKQSTTIICSYVMPASRGYMEGNFLNKADPIEEAILRAIPFLPPLEEFHHRLFWDAITDHES